MLKGTTPHRLCSHLHHGKLVSLLRTPVLATRLHVVDFFRPENITELIFVVVANIALLLYCEYSRNYCIYK